MDLDFVLSVATIAAVFLALWLYARRVKKNGFLVRVAATYPCGGVAQYEERRGRALTFATSGEDTCPNHGRARCDKVVA